MKSALWFLAVGVLTLGASGCMSMQGNHPALEAVNGTNHDTYVEAFIEYGGPQPRFAGPAAFLVHVAARDSGPVEISVTPDALDPAHQADATVKKRQLSSASETLTGEAVRGRLSALAQLMKAEDVAFSGCMTPVRVRLVRTDGALLEKEGCRAAAGWPKAASETVSTLLETRG